MQCFHSTREVKCSSIMGELISYYLSKNLGFPKSKGIPLLNKNHFLIFFGSYPSVPSFPECPNDFYLGSNVREDLQKLKMHNAFQWAALGKMNQQKNAKKA